MIMAIGDSIAHGLAGCSGVEDGGTFPGKPPSYILAHIKAMKPEELADRDIVLSSGTSNGTAEIALVDEEIKELIRKGVDPKRIKLLGVGPRSDLSSYNGELEEIAQHNRVTFVPLTETCTDQVHPHNYNDLLRQVVATAPGGGLTTTDYTILTKEPKNQVGTETLGHLNRNSTLELQTLLKDMGYNLGKFGTHHDGLDAVEGGRNSFTQTAIRKFEQDNGLSSTASFEEVVATMKAVDAAKHMGSLPNGELVASQKTPSIKDENHVSKSYSRQKVD